MKSGWKHESGIEPQEWHSRLTNIFIFIFLGIEKENVDGAMSYFLGIEKGSYDLRVCAPAVPVLTHSLLKVVFPYSIIL